MRRSTQIILIILVGIIFYFNSLFNGFVWDDEFLIKDNPYIRSIPKACSYAFACDLFPGELSNRRTNYYRPLQTISYSLDFFLWGEFAFGFHLTNLLLHIINAILVYLIISLLVSSTLIPFISSLFFVVHPVHHSAVSYISGRADLLAAFFIMGSFYSFLIYRQRFRPKSSHFYFVLSFVFFFLALLSKEYALITPLLFLIFDYCFSKFSKVNLRQYIFFIPLTFIYLMLRIGALGFAISLLGGRYSYLLRQEFSMRFFTFIKSIPLYLSIVIFPINLHMQRSALKLISFLDPWVWVTLMFLFICFFLCRKRRRHNPIALFFFLWVLVFLFSQSYIFLAGCSFAEHFLYLASIAIFFAFASIFVKFLLKFNGNPHKFRFTLVILSSLIIFYGSLTSIHNLNWKDSLTFYRWTLKFAPESIKIRINLAREYGAIGRDDLALLEFERARALLQRVSLHRYKDKPILDWKLKQAIVIAHYNLGVLYASQDRCEEAEREYRQALKLIAHYNLARNNLAAVLTKLDRSQEAIEQLEIILEFDPKNVRAYYNFGAIYANLGKKKKAEDFWRKGLLLEPDNQMILSALQRLKE